MGRPIKEFNYKTLVGSYVLLEDVDKLVDVYKMQCGGRPQDNALFTYCYIDHTAGITFEVLALAERRPDGAIQMGDPIEKTSIKIRYDENFRNVSPQVYDIFFHQYYGIVKRIEEGYKPSDDVQAIRKYDVLDSRRHPQYPDDVLVLFWSQEAAPEQIWVRTEKIIDHQVVGTILNEPNSPVFGVHEGDKIALRIIRSNDEFVPVAMTEEARRNL